jgi:hypothetical protein
VIKTRKIGTKRQYKQSILFLEMMAHFGFNLKTSLNTLEQSMFAKLVIGRR